MGPVEDGWARELDNWSLSNPVTTVQNTEDAKTLQGQNLFPRGRNRVKEDMQVVTGRLCKLTYVCIVGFTVPQIPALLAYSPVNPLYHSSKITTIPKSFWN